MTRKRPQKPDPKPPEVPPMPPPANPPKQLKSRRQMVAVDRARYEILSRIAREHDRSIARELRRVLDEFFRSQGIEPPANGPGV